MPEALQQTLSIAWGQIDLMAHRQQTSVSMLESFKIKLQRNSEDRNHDMKSNGDNPGMENFTVTPERDT